MGDIDKLYDAVSAKFDVGDKATFSSKMQTPQDRKKFYDAAGGKGFDLGDYNDYEKRLSGSTTTVEKKNLSANNTEPSVEPAKQDTKPSEENGYQFSEGIKTPLSTGGTQGEAVNVNPITGTDKTPFDYIFEKQKKAQDHYTNADAAHFDLGVITGNKKVQQAKELIAQINAAPDKKTKETLTTQYQELRKQPAEDVVDNTDWEGSINGRVVKDANVSLLKGKTVGDAIDLIPAKTDEINQNVDAAKTSTGEVQDVISKMRTAAGFSLDKDKKYKEIDWLHNYFNSAGNSIKTIVDGARWALSDDDQRKQMMRQNMVEGQVFPTKGTGSFGSELSGMIGGVTPYILAGMGGAATAGTVGGVLSNSMAMGLSGYNSAAQEAFNEKFQETGNEDEAYKSAQTMSKVGGGMGAVEGAALSLMPGGKLPQGVRDFILKTGQKNAVLGGMFGGARFIENKIAQYEGLKRDSGSGVADSAIDGFLLGTVMDGLHYFPGKISSETKNGFENILARYAYPEVQEAVDKAVQAGIMDNASAYKTLTPIIEKANAFAKMPEMPFEKQQEVLPLMTERNRLEAEKEKSAEAFHAGIDSKIESIDREIAEQTGAPLTLKEQKEYDKLSEKKSATDAEGNTTQLLQHEQDVLDHYNARIKTKELADWHNESERVESEFDKDWDGLPQSQIDKHIADRDANEVERDRLFDEYATDAEKKKAKNLASRVDSFKEKIKEKIGISTNYYDRIHAENNFKEDVVRKLAKGNKLLGKEVKSTKLTAALDEAPKDTKAEVSLQPTDESKPKVEDTPVEPQVENETPKEDEGVEEEQHEPGILETPSEIDIVPELLSEKKFNQKYVGQHKDIRGKIENKSEENKESILANGLNEGTNTNTMPIYSGKHFRDNASGYGNEKGDVVYILPKEGVVKGPNGYKTKGGYKPSKYEVVHIEYDGQSTYEAYKNQIEKASENKRGAEPPAEETPQKKQTVKEKDTTHDKHNGLVSRMRGFNSNNKRTRMSENGIKSREKLISDAEELGYNAVVDRNGKVQMFEGNKKIGYRGDAIQKRTAEDRATEEDYNKAKKRALTADAKDLRTAIMQFFVGGGKVNTEGFKRFVRMSGRRYRKYHGR